MESSASSSNEPSRVNTPNRFTAQAATAEDVLSSQTVGLVQLSDFRKRRAEALEQKEREVTSSHGGRFTPASIPSAATTPSSNGTVTPSGQRSKKRKKTIAKGKVSFGDDEEEPDQANSAKDNSTSRQQTPSNDQNSKDSHDFVEGGQPAERKRIGPNAAVSMAPKAVTKSALLKEAQTREQLRKEFILMQEAVKATEIVMPFVFYDGTNIPGGSCKIRKGEHAWLFLDRSRKVGAELGVGGNEKASSRREWARVGVDDLMLVRGEVIIPHHYEIYYFIINKTTGQNGRRLFDYASTADMTAIQKPTGAAEVNHNPLSQPGKPKAKANGEIIEEDKQLEGVNDDPSFTKVVDRRWYERNKHIFPASVWEEYDPGKDYTKSVRKDVEGNAFFFS